MSHEAHPEAQRPTSQEVDFPLADTISLRTVVNLLLRKGVVTVEELLEVESWNLAWDDAPQTERPHAF
ncbi:MAG: hypothetical protein H5U38_02265 [Calditrichaeota bacterium]|nr:hypothetical protein [Calditrichota bacterium]